MRHIVCRDFSDARFSAANDAMWSAVRVAQVNEWIDIFAGFIFIVSANIGVGVN